MLILSENVWIEYQPFYHECVCIILDHSLTNDGIAIMIRVYQGLVIYLQY